VSRVIAGSQRTPEECRRREEMLMARSVWLRSEAARDESPNDATIMLATARVPLPAPTATRRPFEEEFRRNYPAIRALLDRHREPGLGLVVASGDRLEGTAWVPAEPNGLNPVIIGRHNRAEVFLPSDPSLSLRHLAVLLCADDAGPVRFRVLDLRTATVFEDEHGQRLRALESAGPALVRCASYALLLFPTAASDEPWPEDADAGWARIPERVYLESASADRESWSQPGAVVRRWEPARRSADATTSSVFTFPGPDFLASSGGFDVWKAPPDAGAARGELRLRSASGSGSLLLGAEEARRGVLIGRYERCDGHGLPCLGQPYLSRVHLLVIESGGAFWVIDTASKNGTYDAVGKVRCARLVPGRPLVLAGLVRLEWWPFH
jgi:hypothetical protein